MTAKLTRMRDWALDHVRVVIAAELAIGMVIIAVRNGVT